MTGLVHDILKGVGASVFATIVVAFLLAPTVAASGQDEYRSPPQFERRMQEIASLRNDERRIFDAVERYCEPAVSFRARTIVPGRVVIPKSFALDVLHPDYRRVAEKYPGVYARLKSVIDQYWRAIAKCDDRKCVKTEADGLRARIEKIPEIYQIPRPDLFMLRVAAGHWERCLGAGNIARLDPTYVLAWEEALLNPEVSWQMRRWLLDAVLSFQDPASTPTLGETLRAALRAQDGAERFDRAPIKTIAYHIGDELLFNRRSPEAARELADTIRYLDIDKQKEHLKRIGSAMEEVPEWRDLLNQMETDPEMAPHVRRLREAAEFYRENKPPDTEDSDSR